MQNFILLQCDDKNAYSVIASNSTTPMKAHLIQKQESVTYWYLSDKRLKRS